MPDFPVIETERLILRCPEEGDLDGFAAMLADPKATEFLGGVASRTMAWRALATIAGSWLIKGYGMFSVIEKASGRWVGRVGPWAPEGWPGKEVGWALHSSVWGKGYAREAAEASIDFAFERLGWDEVIHMIDARNTPSQAVATRVGSRRLGHGRLPDVDLDLRCGAKVVRSGGRLEQRTNRARQPGTARLRARKRDCARPPQSFAG